MKKAQRSFFLCPKNIGLDVFWQNTQVDRRNAKNLGREKKESMKIPGTKMSQLLFAFVLVELFCFYIISIKKVIERYDITTKQKIRENKYEEPSCYLGSQKIKEGPLMPNNRNAYILLFEMFFVKV